MLKAVMEMQLLKTQIELNQTLSASYEFGRQTFQNINCICYRLFIEQLLIVYRTNQLMQHLF